MTRPTLSRKSTLLVTAGLLTGALGGMATLSSVFADGDQSTQTVLGSNLILPYDGFLMIDSTPITGTRTIKFDLYESAGGGTSVWTETTTVQLYGGRFSVGLGSSSSLTSVVLDAEKIWLGMTIVEQDSQGNDVEIELAGRQAIEPAPYAAWSGNSAEFNARGVLNVTGNANLNGGAYVSNSTTGANALTVTGKSVLSGEVDVTGDTTVTGDLRVTGADVTSGNVGSIIVNSTGSSDVLYMDGNEIDTSGGLFIQSNRKSSTTFGGTVNFSDDIAMDTNSIVFHDSAGTDHVLTGVDSTYDETGVELRTAANPASGEALFRVLSQSGGERLRIEHDGTNYMNNALEVEGTITAKTDLTVTNDLTVTGTITNIQVSNTYEAYVDAPNNGSSASQTTPMLADTDSICFLVMNDYQSSTTDERSFCRVYNTGGLWYVQAYINDSDDNAYLRCQGRCLVW